MLCEREFTLGGRGSTVCQDLPSALKAALSGKMETAMLGLLKTPAEFDADELKWSVKVGVTRRSSHFLNSTSGHHRPWCPMLKSNNSHIDPEFGCLW